MRIGIAGPLGTPDFEHLLEGDPRRLPREMPGATLLVTLITALIGEGHEVFAYTTDPALTPRRSNCVRAHGRNLTVHYVPRRRHSFRPDRGAPGRMLDFFALERAALADAIRADRPDIIHAHWAYEFAAAALDTGLPCLVTSHDEPWAILRLKRDLYRLGRLMMAKDVLRRAQYISVVSPYLIDSVRRLTRTQPIVIPNPIPTRVFEAGGNRGAPDLRLRPPRLAMLLSGWSRLKNPEAGMSAMRRVRALHPEARMHLYGAGFGPGESAQRWARDHQLEDAFVFHGWLAHPETMRELAAADILLHPSLEESFGLTIAEAMALGVPVVAGADSGAIPWVLGESNGGGILVDVRSPDKIADAILAILDDGELYERCSSRGRQQANSRFSPSAVARSYLQQYQQILDAATSRMAAELGASA